MCCLFGPGGSTMPPTHTRDLLRSGMVVLPRPGGPGRRIGADLAARTQRQAPGWTGPGRPESPLMSDHDHYSDDLLREILRGVRLIAMVGASPDWNRPRYFAMKYLQAKGYRVIPVNPRAAGQAILGETVYPDLAALPATPDMVDIFRNSEAAGPLTDQAIALGARVVWMQLGVRNDAAAARAEAAGLRVVMNRRPKIEYMRLSGELGWQGINTEVLTSKRRPLTRATRKLM